jgi:hypothetical protein
LVVGAAVSDDECAGVHAIARLVAETIAWLTVHVKLTAAVGVEIPVRDHAAEMAPALQCAAR